MFSKFYFFKITKNKKKFLKICSSSLFSIFVLHCSFKKHFHSFVALTLADFSTLAVSPSAVFVPRLAKLSLKIQSPVDEISRSFLSAFRPLVFPKRMLATFVIKNTTPIRRSGLSLEYVNKLSRSLR